MGLFTELAYSEYKPSGRDNDILGWFSKSILEMDEARRPFADEWKVLQDRVFIYPRMAKGDDASDIAGDTGATAHSQFPHEFSVIRRKMADLIRTPPTANFYTATNENVWRLEAFKKVWERLISDASATTQFTYAFLDMFVKGVGILETGYIEEYRMIKDPEYLMGEDGTIEYSPKNIIGYKEKKILDYDGLFIMRRDPKDVWFSVGAIDVHGLYGRADVAIVHDVYDINVFRKKFEGFKNINCVVPEGLEYSEYIMANDDETEQEEEETEGQNWVHVFRAYVHSEDECFFIANGVVIYDGCIPFSHKQLPVIILKNFPYAGNLYSPSDVSFMQQLSEVKNVLINLALDNKKQALNPRPVYSGNEIDETDFFDPCHPIRISEGKSVRESVQFMQVPDVSQGVDSLLNLIEEYQMIATGVDSRALTPPPSERATQTAIKREIGNIILDLTIKFNEANGLKTCFEQLVKNVMEFYPREKARNYITAEGIVEELVGFPELSLKNTKVSYKEDKETGIQNVIFEEAEGEVSLFEVKPEFIRQQLIVEVKEGTMRGVLEELELQKWNEQTQIYGSIPEARQMIDWKKWMRNTLKKYKENPDDYLMETHVAEMKSTITEPIRELRMLIMGEEYVPPVEIDHKAHAESLRKFMMSDEFRLGMFGLDGKRKPLPLDIKQKIAMAFKMHLETSLIGDKGIGEEKQKMQEEQMQQQQEALVQHQQEGAVSMQSQPGAGRSPQNTDTAEGKIRQLGGKLGQASSMQKN